MVLNTARITTSVGQRHVPARRPRETVARRALRRSEGNRGGQTCDPELLPLLTRSSDGRSHVTGHLRALHPQSRKNTLTCNSAHEAGQIDASSPSLIALYFLAKRHHRQQCRATSKVSLYFYHIRDKLHCQRSMGRSAACESAECTNGMQVYFNARIRAAS
jgi:hypothetical protein